MSQSVREWTLHEEVGHGGMGVVYRATHRFMGGDWAVKVMRPELGRDDGARARFLREMGILALLDDRRIVKLLAPFEEDGRLYLPMEYLSGRSLAEELRETPGPWPTGRAVEIVREASEAVGMAHRLKPQPVLHRDIKPGNIQILADGRVKVLDFGLAVALGDESITADGQVVGSPKYMAPEMLDGLKATPRSDVYALGLVLYRLLAGRLPYDVPEEESSIQAVFVAVIRGLERGLPDVREFAPSVPSDVAELVMRTLSRDPAGRPADGAELASLLGRVDLGKGTGAGTGTGTGTGSGTEESYGRMKIRPSGTGTGTGTGTGAPGPEADSTHLGLDLDVAQPAPVQAGRDIASSSSHGSDDLDRSLLDIAVPGTGARAFASTPVHLVGPSEPVEVRKPRKVMVSLVLVAVAAIVTVSALGVWYLGYELPRRQAEASRIEAEKAADEQACGDARSGGTEVSWTSYLTAHPGGQCYQEAQSEIGRLQEAARQEAARQEAARQEAARQEEARQEAARMYGVEWVRVPGGTFQMGSDDSDAWYCEKPVHSVTVSTFEIAKTETTVAQYRKCVEAGGCSAPYNNGLGYCNWGKSDRENHPVNCIDWNQASAYAKWVGGRLPTEAEWEYAARSGGRDQKYPWGNQAATCTYAVMNAGSGGGCGRESTWPVCSKASGNTSQGLCDMAGNIWEWVSDWYGTYGSGSVTNPTGPSSGSRRVLRGGSFFCTAGDVRASSRYNRVPGDSYSSHGLRPARSVR